MAQDAHKALLHDRILHFIERENHNLTRAVANARIFTDWLDEFYIGREGAPPTLSALADSIIGPSIRASCSAGLDARGIAAAVLVYARKRHSTLLEACSEVTKDQLPGAIEKLTNGEQGLVAQGLLATALGEL